MKTAMTPKQLEEAQKKLARVGRLEFVRQGLRQHSDDSPVLIGQVGEAYLLVPPEAQAEIVKLCRVSLRAEAKRITAELEALGVIMPVAEPERPPGAITRAQLRQKAATTAPRAKRGRT